MVLIPRNRILPTQNSDYSKRKHNVFIFQISLALSLPHITRPQGLTPPSRSKSLFISTHHKCIVRLQFRSGTVIIIPLPNDNFSVYQNNKK